MERKVTLELSSADILLIRYAIEYKRDVMLHECRAQFKNTRPNYDLVLDCLDDIKALEHFLDKFPKE